MVTLEVWRFLSSIQLGFVVYQGIVWLPLVVAENK